MAGEDLIVPIIVALCLGGGIGFYFTLSRRKTWYLETMDPRQHYEVGAEKGYITHLSIKNRFFNGIRADKYQLLLFYGSLDQFSKPVMSGKLEEIYSVVLAQSMIGRKMVNSAERFHFLDFLWKHVPAMNIKAHMITGELISPQDVLDYYWQGKDRDEAYFEMKRRGLINSKVLWIKPYPPEDKFKEIMSGTLMIPDLMIGHVKEYQLLTASQRKIMLQMDAGMSLLVREVIGLAREIVPSISDPIHVMGLIISDRIRKIKGLGLEQLAERGSYQALVEVAKHLKEHRDELNKALTETPKPEEYEAMMQKIAGMEAQLQKLQEASGKGQPPALPAAAPAAVTPAQ